MALPPSPISMDHSRTKEDTYALKRDYNASSRLLGQHHLWKSELGYLIHPSIPIPQQPRIADVATGNGCWLLDVATNLGDLYNLHGFDISLDQAPITSSDPTSFATMHFHTWDILTDPPRFFVGAFDIVHIRLITVVFSDNEKAIPIIESLRKLLKPGGYLQWEEVDNTTCTVLPPADGGGAPAMEQALAQLASSGKGGWKQDAARLLNKNGFSNAQQFHIEPTEYYSRYWTDIYLACWAEFAGKVLGNPEQAKILGEQAMKEARRGAVIRCPMWVWIAQKSMSAYGISNIIPKGRSPIPRVPTLPNLRPGTPTLRPDTPIAGLGDVPAVAITKGSLEQNAASESPTAKDAPSFRPGRLQRSKIYKSLSRLRAAG